MKKLLSVSALLFLSGCLSTPESVGFKGEQVGTFSVAAGCDTMQLDTDCSGLYGAKRDISISQIPLRIASGNDGKIVFIMPESTFGTDERNLLKGSDAVEKLFELEGVKVTSKKVMFGNDEVYGVHYVLDSNGYALLKKLSL